MDEAKLKSLLDQASERYNEGLYEEAIAQWREVLAQDPSNQKAREGIRMASLLTADWAETPGVAPEPENDPQRVRERIEAGVARVKQLAGAGQFSEALEGCDLLSEIAPDLAEIARLKSQVQRASEASSGSSPAGGIEHYLEVARQALSDGRNRQAAEAANRALQIDPSNMEACGILSMAADDATVGSPVSIGAGGLHPSGHEFETGPFSLDASAGEEADGGSAAILGDQDPRVTALIKEGHAALAASRPEEAIAIWSRIFAIDRANAEAGTLIDRAKAAIEEQARRVDDIYYKAVDANEAGRREEALDLFQQVLALAPNHPEARSSVEELKARLGGLGDDLDASFGSLEEPKPQVEITRKKKPAAHSAPADLASVPLADLGSERLHSPRTTDIRRDVAVKPAIISARKGGGSSSRLLVAIAGSLVVGVAGVGAWLWFGSSTGSMPEAEATAPVPVKIARKSQGSPPPAPEQSPGAIEVLPGASPKTETPAPPPPPVDPEVLKAQGAALTREGRQYFQEQRWADAVITFKKAIAADPVDFDAQDQLDEAMSRLQKAADLEREMSQAVKYFGEGDYASALHKFYRLQQDRTEMKILETYIRNSWFNWGVLMLQSGSVDEAVEKFDEALQINPHDPQATRAREIAKRYHGRPRDTVYDAFTNALQLRALDQP